MQLRDNKTYIGRSGDLARRVSEHKHGKVRSTKGKEPRLIYYEAYSNKPDVVARELYLKTGDGRQYLKKQLRNTLWRS